MEIKNIQYHNNEMEEILLADFKENDKILAQLFISKDNINLEKHISKLKKARVIYPSTVLDEEPFTHMIAITTLSSKDSYVTTLEEIEKEHKEILAQISSFITNITGISPIYTKTDDKPVESVETFSARVIVEINLINKILNCLKEYRIEEEKEKIKKQEEQLIKQKKYV